MNMADIELIIKIPEEEYKRLAYIDILKLRGYIENGTPLEQESNIWSLNGAREEAIKCLKVELRIWESDCKSKHAVKDALKMAIKALEQEPILDKIRADIKQMDFDFGDFYDHTSTIIEMVLEVIDKYKAESEK